MKKILLGGAGGTPTENLIDSLIYSGDKEKIIGIGSEKFDLITSKAHKKILIPYATDSKYKETLLSIIAKEKPNFIHFQNDIEILEASKFRNEIIGRGTKIYMPNHEVIENCVDKYKSYLIWKENNVPVAETLLIKNEDDLKQAFKEFTLEDKKIWIRSTIGGGGKGALPTDSYNFAKEWIDHHDGWGHFTASEILSKKSVTFLTIWHEGKLIVGQSRLRLGWNLGNRTLSGITGVTKAAITISDEKVTKIAMDAIKAIDAKPHGIYGVDMTYSKNNEIKVTEINISRFFTTVYFFTKAGLNFPKIFKDIVLYNKFPNLNKPINPLDSGLVWIRSMDKEALLIENDRIEDCYDDFVG